MSAYEIIEEKFRTGEFEYKRGSDICRLLGVSGKSEKAAVFAVLDSLEREGRIVLDPKNRYVLPERLGLVKGTLRGNERGFAFLEREEGEDVFIPHRALAGAMHGDTVLVKIVRGERGEEGEVYSVLERGMSVVTGTYFRERRGGYVSPDDRRFFDDIRVTGGNVRAVTGEKVLVRLTAFPAGRSPEGVVEEVLGRSGELPAEEDAIIRAAGLAEQFPEKVSAEARRAAAEKMPRGGREDLTDLLTVTIDGEDARDFDDAISVGREGELFRLYVHIADVSHYVKRGGALDKEAFSRGTSVYFPDRVLPMLPEELCNGACSLLQGEDRLTVTCEALVDGAGNAKDCRIYESVIRSDRRMTYTEVAKILDGDADARKDCEQISKMLADAAALSDILVARREKRGGIDLDVKEAKISLTEKGVEVEPYERTAAHRMIEAFMIFANERVAEFLQGYEMPCLFRVHEKPSEEKANAFKAYLASMGLRAGFRAENVRPYDYAKILSSLDGDPLRRVVNRVMLRSMSKARYSAENAGHFGLASDCYCHFTSPIRRYPDLFVHRVLKFVLNGRAEDAEKLSSFAPAAALRCSETERRADEAERDVDELYKCWFMRGRIGESYEGVVSGVAAFGVFVELDNSVEGLIRAEDLPEDDYVFSEERLTLSGADRAYKIGDKIRVVVAACDIGARRVRFVPETDARKAQ